MGATCEYTRWVCLPCLGCTPQYFQPAELLLTAIPGGNAHGEAGFTAHGPTDWCDFHVETGEPWAAAHVRCTASPTAYILEVDADASSLDPGTYETWIQVSAYNCVARCIDLTFEVLPTSGLPGPADRVRTLSTWGRIKATHR